MSGALASLSTIDIWSESAQSLSTRSIPELKEQVPKEYHGGSSAVEQVHCHNSRRSGAADVV